MSPAMCILFTTTCLLQTLSYQLSPAQLTDSWPLDVNISTFVFQTSSQLIEAYIESYCMELSQTLTDMLATQQTLQQYISGNITVMQQILTTFNDSTAMDDTFFRYSINQSFNQLINQSIQSEACRPFLSINAYLHSKLLFCLLLQSISGICKIMLYDVRSCCAREIVIGSTLSLLLFPLRYF